MTDRTSALILQVEYVPPEEKRTTAVIAQVEYRELPKPLASALILQLEYKRGIAKKYDVQELL